LVLSEDFGLTFDRAAVGERADLEVAFEAGFFGCLETLSSKNNNDIAMMHQP